MNFRGFNKFWRKWVVQHNRRVLFQKVFLFTGACPPPGNFENRYYRRRIFLQFEVHFYFALLFLEVNQFEQIWRKKTQHVLKSIPERCTKLSTKKRNMISKFDHRKWALSMSSTNVGKNLYRSISLILTWEQNILITSWHNLLATSVFILSSRFLLISADAQHIF